MKKRITKKISYTHKNGEILEGFREIEGTIKIRQIVVYNGQYKIDDAIYAKGQEAVMEAMAEQIMFEFASGRTLSTKKYVKNIKF